VTDLLRDEFLSGIVGRPAFRVALPQQGCDGAGLAAIRAAQSRPVFLYAKLPTFSVRAIRQLDELGFHVVDTTVTFERPAGDPPAAGSTRHAAPQDRDAVMDLARQCFSHSRLHLDPAISRQAADHSRAEWAGNFFVGRRGDHMIVGESDGALAGFAQLLSPRDGTLTIDLIGVAAAFRRRGIAGALVAAAGAIAGTRTLRVGTQIANIPSLRLYETLGFRIVETQYVLHYHRA
jgi:ribosomal protein S18 acetylase RimI-like enzyme